MPHSAARLAAAVLVLVALAPAPARAHGDASIPLYVAADGRDTGDCSDPAAPCETLDYALRQAGKDTQIRVAAGRFPVGGSEDLFLIVSGVVDVVGGFEPESQFAKPSQHQASILTGVPVEYREALAARGFHVIADTKAEAAPLARATGKLLDLHGKLQKGAAPGPCVNGMVDSLTCENVDLLSHVTFGDLSAAPSRGNDVWGFVDLNTGREYAIAGFNLGTAVIDVSDPSAPREVGFIDGQTAGWRDVKIFQRYDAAAGRYHAYAYVTTDGSSDGLFVIDLGGLPHRVRRLPYPSQFSAAHNVYSSSTDFATGLPLTDAPRLIVAGSNLAGGRYRAYDLADPASPGFVGESTGGYMHDAASLVIDDARTASCPNATGSCELLLDFNEGSFDIWDITDITDPVHLNAGNGGYSQLGYVHSGWWTEDRQHAFVHDELDEQRFGRNTTLRVFSLANLANPQLVDTWTGPTPAIDHNGFVRGNRYYMSNYTRGLTVLDITDPADPQPVGLLDTYPFSNGQNFFGAWGAYPFFPTGTIAISDINSGVYFVRDTTRDVAGGQLAFGAASFAAVEGNAAAAAVNRSGGTVGSVAVDVEIVHATADGDDYVLQTTNLAWADGDGTARNIGVDVAADGIGEDLELLVLRLVNPTGGATLGDANTAHLYLADPGAQPGIRLFADTIEVAERGFARAVLVLHRTGDASGAASVDYNVAPVSADASDYDGSTSGTVSWAAGDGSPKWLEFTIADDGAAEGDETFDVAFTNASGAAISGPATAQVTIQDGSGTNVAPNAVVAAGTSVSENTAVTLDGSDSNDPDGDAIDFSWAQTGGPTVALSSQTSPTTEFTTPTVSSDTLLTFQLTVTDPDGLSDTATATVTVTNAGSSGGDADGGSGGGAAGWLLLTVLATLACRRRRPAIRRDAA